MSKINYVSDSHAIIATQGLRMVSKSDYRWSHDASGTDRYYLELEYRGLSKKVEYANIQERDAMYSNLALLLTPRAAELAGVCEHGVSRQIGDCPKCNPPHKSPIR